MNDVSVPICVDLDGTLTPVDTLHEGLLSLCRQSPGSLLSIPQWLGRGKAAFKQAIVDRTDIHIPLLPFHGELLQWLKTQKQSGRYLVLATAAHQTTATGIATHLNLFDEVIASNEADNLSGEHKRRALVERFGEKGFDYVGNDAVDLAVWRSARHAYVVGSDNLAARAGKIAEVAQVFPVNPPRLGTWLKAIRVHQWVKNCLVFLPALLAHKITDPAVFSASVLAFLAFCTCASSVYLVNDLLDLASDRRHPRKRFRPFASGALSAQSGLAAALLLLVTSIAIAISVGIWFCAALALYYIFTWAYSLRLKRAAIVDVLTLAGLYTLRIVAGAAATLIQPSFWLLAFSIFVFLSLGIVKRYAELFDARQAGKAGGHGRGYSGDDLAVLMSLGTASGYGAIIVMAFYINSPDAQTLYKNSQPLWLICPLMLYWISRVWLLASRGQMNDDPVVFALRDRLSMVVFALIGVVVLLAL